MTVEALGLGLRLTLVTLLLRPVGGELQLLFLGTASLGLLVPALLRRWQLFATLAVLAALRVVLDWPLPDNHAYLLVYWSLACAIALARGEGAEERLAEAATLLIGLVFAFASLWKLGLSPDFLSGNFMRFTWMVDERFAGAAQLLGSLAPEHLDANRAFLAGARDAPAALVEPRALRFTTALATGFTAFVEPAIALAYLWRGERGPARLRTALLVSFCATTFAFAPVAGFAWLLLAMEAVRCGGSRVRTGSVLATFALVLAYRELFEAGGWAILLP